MKNVLALFALVLAFTITSATAQTTTKKERNKATTEQTVSTTAPAAKACCASHGPKAEAKATTTDVKTASTTHEHAGKTCDPANCTEAQKKQCAGAKGKGCCAGSAAKAEETARP